MIEIYKVRQLLNDFTPELTYQEDSFLTVAQVYAKEFGLLPVKEAEDRVDILVSKPNGFRVIASFTRLCGDIPYVQKTSMWDAG